MFSSRGDTSELRRLVDGHINNNIRDYLSNSARADFNRYEMRNSIKVEEVVEVVDDHSETHIAITFKKELAQLLNLETLVSGILSNSDDLQDRHGYEGEFSKSIKENGDVVLNYYGSAYRGSKPYMECAIPFYVEKQHERMLKQNPRVFPLFHARMEMDKLLEETKDIHKRNVLNAKLEEYKRTMIDLMNVLDVLEGRKSDMGSAGYWLETGEEEKMGLRRFKGDKHYHQVQFSTKDDLNNDKAFEKLLLQLHRQSKEMLISKKGAVIGGLMMAFGALMVAAGITLGFTLGWTGIGLGVGVGLSVAGAGLFAGGLVAIKEREHFSKIGRRMNDFYNTHKLYKDEIDKPAQPDADNTVRMRK